MYLDGYKEKWLVSKLQFAPRQLLDICSCNVLLQYIHVSILRCSTTYVHVGMNGFVTAYPYAVPFGQPVADQKHQERF